MHALVVNSACEGIAQHILDPAPAQTVDLDDGSIVRSDAHLHHAVPVVWRKPAGQ